MADTARHRVQRRIQERLAELGMTGRKFAAQFGHKDGWVNAILGGRNALKLDDLDRAAHVLKMTAGDLVRQGEDAWDLRPTEMRLIRALRLLPPTLQDHLVILAEYLIGVLPDEIEHLAEFRELTDEQRGWIRHWTHVFLIAGELGPGRAAPADPGEIVAPPDVQARRSRGRKREA